MGKPFASELSKLSQTLDIASSLDLGNLPRCIDAACGGTVLLIGTGGSLTAAEFGRRLFDQRGIFADAITPLEFLQSGVCLRRSSVFILSAGGNNKDVLAAFRAARDREAARVVVISAARRSKLALLSAESERASAFEFSLPSGRDGYLALNSLLATCVLVARAFDERTPSAADAIGLVDYGSQGYIKEFSGQTPTHFVILSAGWGRPAAVDLESKLSEAGLAGSMLADFRHFAHGRHNWLDKQRSQTSVLVLSTTEDERLAKATLARLPSSIPVCRFHASLPGAAGGLELLLTTFGFIAALGHARGIDPGRPGVPEYGSRLYGLGPIGIAQSTKLDSKKLNVSAAIDRKAAAISGGVDRHEIQKQCESFLARLRGAVFGAFVTDLDGTVLPLSARDGPIPERVVHGLLRLLEADVPIFLATGRGDSANEVILATFPPKCRHLVHVGYFNGAFCLALAHADKFKTYNKRFPGLDDFCKKLQNRIHASNLGELRNKGWQVTIKPNPGACVEILAARLQEELARASGYDVRVVISSHSIDLLPREVSKANCLQVAQRKLKTGLEVLAVGDCGAYLGNDYELLSHRFSLSVDSVSADLDTCWNLLPRGISHTHGMACYLSRLAIQTGRFTFQP